MNGAAAGGPARRGEAPRRPAPHVLVRIQHHPARADMIPGLLERLEGLDVQVVADPDPDSLVRSPWRTYRQCVAAVPAGYTHVLTLQDDTIPCSHFADAVAHVTVDRPGSLVTMFLPGALGLVAKIATRQAAKGERYVSLERGPWVPTVALLWPVGLIDEFRAVCDDWARASRKPQVSDDALVGRFRRESCCDAVATVPSLVQHPDTVRSIVTNRPTPTGRNKLRTAHQWRGPEWSPVDAGWVPSDAPV